MACDGLVRATEFSELIGASGQRMLTVPMIAWSGIDTELSSLTVPKRIELLPSIAWLDPSIRVLNSLR